MEKYEFTYGMIWEPFQIAYDWLPTLITNNYNLIMIAIECKRNGSALDLINITAVK